MKATFNPDGKIDVELTEEQFVSIVKALQNAVTKERKPTKLTLTVTPEISYGGEEYAAKFGPTSGQIRDYIESKGDPDMTHTVAEIEKHFLHRKVNSKKELVLYSRIFNHLQTAQHWLEAKYGRKFSKARVLASNFEGDKAPIATYSLKPSMRNGLTITANTIIPQGTLVAKATSGGIQR